MKLRNLEGTEHFLSFIHSFIYFSFFLPFLLSFSHLLSLTLVLYPHTLSGEVLSYAAQSQRSSKEVKIYTTEKRTGNFTKTFCIHASDDKKKQKKTHLNFSAQLMFLKRLNTHCKSLQQVNANSSLATAYPVFAKSTKSFPEPGTPCLLSPILIPGHSDGVRGSIALPAWECGSTLPGRNVR